MVAGLIGWVLLLQGMLALFAPFGAWQLPGIAKVTITQVQQDETGKLNGNVVATQSGRVRALRMDKAECADLEVDTEVWILDNYFVNGARPDQFRLTPLRLLTEYPQPLLALILWLIWLIHRSQARETKAVEDNPARVRAVWRDEFYTRADAFAAPKDSGKKE